jgi:GTPase Era involved in 16S rRNA processing
MAQYEDLTIDQGTDVAIEIHLVNGDGSAKNLTNHSIAAKMKRTYNSDSDDTHNFTAIISSPATDGIAVLSLTNTQTDVLKPGRYVYDAELSYNDSDENTIVERVLEGKILVTASVTR